MDKVIEHTLFKGRVSKELNDARFAEFVQGVYYSSEYHKEGSSSKLLLASVLGDRLSSEFGESYAEYLDGEKLTDKVNGLTLLSRRVSINGGKDVVIYRLQNKPRVYELLQELWEDSPDIKHSAKGEPLLVRVLGAIPKEHKDKSIPIWLIESLQ